MVCGRKKATVHANKYNVSDTHQKANATRRFLVHEIHNLARPHDVFQLALELFRREDVSRCKDLLLRTFLGFDLHLVRLVSVCRYSPGPSGQFQIAQVCWTLRRFHISSTTAIDYHVFPVGIALKTLLIGRIFAKFEDLGVVHVGDQFLRFFAELVDLLRLAQVLKEVFFVLVLLELLDQLLDLVLTRCILLFHC